MIGFLVFFGWFSLFGFAENKKRNDLISRRCVCVTMDENSSNRRKKQKQTPKKQTNHSFELPTSATGMRKPMYTT